VRWVSYEPALGQVDFGVIPQAMDNNEPTQAQIDSDFGLHYIRHGAPGIDWIVAGGESGPGARPCDLSWLRSVRDQCAEAGVPCFVKQLGSISIAPDVRRYSNGSKSVLYLKDRKGGDPAEWPADLRVRQMPARAAGARG